MERLAPETKPGHRRQRPAVREHLVSGLQSPISNLSTAGVRRSGQQTIHHLNLVPGYCLHTAYHQHSCSSLATTSTNTHLHRRTHTSYTKAKNTPQPANHNDNTPGAASWNGANIRSRHSSSCLSRRYVVLCVRVLHMHHVIAAR